MYNPPQILLGPAPRNITPNEEFLSRSRLLLWTKAGLWPAIGAVMMCVYAYNQRHMLMFGVVMFLIFLAAGVVAFFIRYPKFKKTVKLLNEGILCNGYVQYHVQNFRNGTTDFEVLYTHPVTGTTLKGTVGMSYYNKMKFPLNHNAVVPLFIDPIDPTKFTIWVPNCAMSVGTAAWF